VSSTGLNAGRWELGAATCGGRHARRLRSHRARYHVTGQATSVHMCPECWNKIEKTGKQMGSGSRTRTYRRAGHVHCHFWYLFHIAVLVCRRAEEERRHVGDAGWCSVQHCRQSTWRCCTLLFLLARPTFLCPARNLIDAISVLAVPLKFRRTTAGR
jgi:hypothetical protein